MKKVIIFLSIVTLSLAIPREDFYSFGTSAGDTAIPSNDDGSSGPIALQFGSFPYFEEQYTTLYVNNNGVISFAGAVTTFTPESFPLQGFSLIAPYWADVDTRGTGTVFYRETRSSDIMRRARDDVLSAFSIRFQPIFAFIATWDRVGHYNRDTERIATFQCVLMTDGIVSYVKFLYADGEIQWTTGDASSGVNGFGGTPAQVGFDAGDRERFFSVPGSQTDSIVNIPTTTNVNVPGVWTFQVNGDIARCSNLEDMENTPLVITPRVGSMLGGTAVSISSMCLEDTDSITCQYEGFEIMDADIRESDADDEVANQAIAALCVSPSFPQPGSKRLRIIVVSESGMTKYDTTTQFYAQHIEEINEVTLNNLQSPLLNPQSRISISWEPHGLLPAHVLNPTSYQVTIVLALLDMSTREWVEVPNGIINPSRENTGQAVVTLSENIRIDGSQVLDVRPATIQVRIDAGSRVMRQKRVAPLLLSLGRVIRWGRIIYYSFSNSLSPLCDIWCQNQPENIGQTILDELAMFAPCAPRVDQARSPNSGLVEDIGVSRDLSNGLFHPGTETCFRSEGASPSGYGQQCCYDSNGLLVVGSPGGGSVDKVSPIHDVLGHFLEDVIPAILCCHGTVSNCDTYYQKRPSDNGESYNPPNPACIYGDPHIVTLDGSKYTFNGRGEYLLVQVDDEFTFQGRMIPPIISPAGNTISATVFSAIAMSERNNTVQFQVGAFPDDPDALINSSFIDFTDIASQDFNGVVITKAGNTLSARFPSGAFIEVREENGFFSTLLVSLPSSWQGRTRGLMGNYNGDTSDDFTPLMGDPLSLDSELRTIHESFGVTWIISDQQDSIFTYSNGESFNDYFFPDFEPTFDITFSDPALEQAANDICGDDLFCLFDIATTESTTIGLSTLMGAQEFDQIVNNSQPTVCDPPCANGACVATDVCSCSVGYTGPQCDTPMFTECDVNPCENGGSCNNLAGSFICSCPPGYTGLSCETEDVLQSGFGSGLGSGLGSGIGSGSGMIDHCSELCMSVECTVEGEVVEPGVATVTGTVLKCFTSSTDSSSTQQQSNGRVVIDRIAIDPSFTEEYFAPGSRALLERLGYFMTNGNDETCSVPNGLRFANEDGYFRTQSLRMDNFDSMNPEFSENLGPPENRCSLDNLLQWLMVQSSVPLPSPQCRNGNILFTVECSN